MFFIPAMVSQTVRFPFWVLWAAYSAAWWAFDDSDKPAPDGRPVVRPGAALRWGYVATLAVSLLGAVLAALGAENHVISGAQAWGLWVWATFAGLAGSLYTVKRVTQPHTVKPLKDWGATAAGACKGAGQAGRRAWTVTSGGARKAAGWARTHLPRNSGSAA